MLSECEKENPILVARNLVELDRYGLKLGTHPETAMTRTHLDLAQYDGDYLSEW
jgi:hypothetical protein